MTHDLSRLPKWAQQHIANLERNLASVRAELAAGPEDSDTFVRDYVHGDRPLGAKPTIEFRFPDTTYGRRNVQVRLRDDDLFVMGSDSISVEPQSSNVIQIRLTR